MSLPNPIAEAFLARTTPSPPELPPLVNAVTTGLCVSPKIGLLHSNVRRVCGTFVLAIRTAPSRVKVEYSVDEVLWGLLANVDIPREQSYPSTAKVSLRVKGMP